MKIAFLVNHVYINDGWSPYDTRLGGTEEGVVQWSTLLSDAGHDVTVFQNGFVGDFEGVEYCDRDEYDSVAQYYDVTLNHKSLDKSIIGKTYYFTTETDATGKDLSRFDAVVWPSHWAKDNIPVNNDRVEVINYGYDPDKIYLSDNKIPKQCLYASSPDRGLDTLLELWPKVVEAHPDAQLIVTYGAEPRDIPNVTFLGEVDEETMNELYMSSEYWLHPCSGGELFGITAVKAQAAGCWPIYFPTMALAETVQYGDACKDADEMADMIIKRMDVEPPTYEIIRPLPTWESTAQDILNLITLPSAPRIEGQ